MMTAPPRDTAQIHKAFNMAFDDVTFSAFCFNYYLSLYDRFSQGMRKDEKITWLLDYCRRRPTGFETLLAHVRTEYTYPAESGNNALPEELKPLIDALEVYMGLSLPIVDTTKDEAKSGSGHAHTQPDVRETESLTTSSISHLKETSNVRLLLAEDRAQHLQRAKRWLKRYGYEQIVEARSAKEAREILQREHFDIIIADMRMEADDSGFTIIEEVKNRNITSMVIVLTANDTVDDCRRALNWSGGAWDYISKNMRGNPFEEIHKAIQAAITYLNRWGNSKDEAWISENMDHLLQNYRGQYIAVMNNAVIEAADKQETLQQRIQERKLPLFLTVIKKIDYELYGQLPEKLTVFVEGPTDVRYIETALKFFGQNDLLTQIHLDTIGNKIGGKGGGHTNLKSAFDFLKENPKFRHHKVLFLFDPDVKDGQLPNKGQDFENLFVRRMAAHSAEKRGIESLFAAKIFEEGHQKGFVKKTAVYLPGVSEPIISYKIENKKLFCDWICDERQNSWSDFEEFETILHDIESIL